MDLTKKVRRTVLRYKLFSARDKVIVAVSGGPDSTFLLHALAALRHSLGISLCVAHLNHGLRKNSSADQRFVEKLAAEYQLPFITKSVKIPQKKGSLEEAARNIRFEFLMDTAKKQGAKIIALGHTKDDLAETVLMRILRGTGLYGLRAILPKRAFNNFLFVRPLIDLKKAEVLSFLKKEKMKFRIDATNRNASFFRNRIRHKLLPLLTKDYNQDITNVLTHLSNTVSADYDYLEKEGKKFTHNYVWMTKAGKVCVALDRLNKLHPALKRIALRQAIEQLKGNMRRLAFDHIEKLENLSTALPENSRISLPHQIIATREKKYLCLTIRNS